MIVPQIVPLAPVGPGVVVSKRMVVTGDVAMNENVRVE